MLAWFSDASVFGFLLEAVDAVVVRGEPRGQDIQRHVTLELGIARARPRPCAARTTDELNAAINEFLREVLWRNAAAR